MNATRVQIHLRYFFDGDDVLSKQVHNFWYAFQPTQLVTINDVIEDIRLNYLNDQLSFLTEGNDGRTLIIHLDDCQLLPFTSSQILRDNDRLILMPLQKYKLHKIALQESANLNLSSSISVEPVTNSSETNHKRQRIESVEKNIPSPSAMTIVTPTIDVDEQPRKKTTKPKSNGDHVVLPPAVNNLTPELPVRQIVLEPPIVQPQLPREPLVALSKPPIAQESVIDKEDSSEAPPSIPSTNGRLRELKSKTATWKPQKPAPQANAQDKMHIRFDSESDEEPLPEVQPTIEESKTATPLPLVNGSNSSVRILYVPTPTDTVQTSSPIHLVRTLAPADVVSKPEESKNQQKSIDLLFEIKQHKTLDEKQAKKLQQQFGRKRAQQRKRALDYLSMANFVDQAFGLDKNGQENQVASNGHHQSSSPAQTLPASFSKLARLPLVAEAIENNDKMYDLYPPVTQCPAIQTRIAFKLLELGEDFCPKMSAFKEGTVMDVNATTGEVTILLDIPNTTVFDQPSKFYAPSDGPVDDDAKTVIASFSDLNSIRLLSTPDDPVMT